MHPLRSTDDANESAQKRIGKTRHNYRLDRSRAWRSISSGQRSVPACVSTRFHNQFRALSKAASFGIGADGFFHPGFGACAIETRIHGSQLHLTEDRSELAKLLAGKFVVTPECPDHVRT